jgi:hypothetical protein
MTWRALAGRLYDSDRYAGFLQGTALWFGQIVTPLGMFITGEAWPVANQIMASGENTIMSEDIVLGEVATLAHNGQG